MKNLTRSFRYFLKLVVVIGLALGILAAFDMLNVRGEEFFAALFVSRRGLMLIGIMIILALVYPRLAFTTLDVRALDFTGDREKIIESFDSYGYRLDSEESVKMVFRARSFGRKLASQWDDAMTVTRERTGISVEGLKKDVVRINLRLTSFV